MRAALAKWSRCSELTADRAGLLACRALGTALRVHLKFAGGNRPGTVERTELSLGAFTRQARALAEMEEASPFDSAVAVLLSIKRSHPFAAWRLMHLVQWVETGSYLDILAGDYRKLSREAA